MGKIRGDARKIALAHPTRAALYAKLKNNTELATVELEKEVNVTRYHLYHHLKQLQTVGLVENHRDQGRAKYWRVTEILTTPVVDDTIPDSTIENRGWMDSIPSELIELLEANGEVHFIPITSSARDAINSRSIINKIANEHGVDMELPFTFVPGGILIVSRRSR